MRLVNDRAVAAARALLDTGIDPETIAAKVAGMLAARRQTGRDAPHHLGDSGIVK